MVNLGEFDGLHCPECGGKLKHIGKHDVGHGRTFSNFMCAECGRGWYEALHTKTGRQMEWGRYYS